MNVILHSFWGDSKENEKEKEKEKRKKKKKHFLSSLVKAVRHNKFFPLYDVDNKVVSSSVAVFSARFIKEAGKGKNVVASPLSAEFVLALLALGASDPSRSELLSALGLSNDDSIRSAFSSLSTRMRSLKGVKMDVANRVWVMEGAHELEPALQVFAVKVFDAKVEKIDFAKGSEAAKRINKWIEGKTKKKVTDLISSRSLNKDTNLVLVNALYFKGFWKMKFDPKLTKDRAFNVSAKKTINLPMMYKAARYKHGASSRLQAQFLEIPYKGDQATMVIVLPFKTEGLVDVLQKLADGYDLNSDLKNMTTKKVLATIPKFQIESEYDLTALLPKLGIKSIFKHNDSGLDKLVSPPETLSVSKAVQKAFIEVNEEGTEAAAATGTDATPTRADSVPTFFVANKPFLYILFGPERSTLFNGVFCGATGSASELLASYCSVS